MWISVDHTAKEHIFLFRAQVQTTKRNISLSSTAALNRGVLPLTLSPKFKYTNIQILFTAGLVRTTKQIVSSQTNMCFNLKKYQGIMEPDF